MIVSLRYKVGVLAGLIFLARTVQKLDREATSDIAGHR